MNFKLLIYALLIPLFFSCEQESQSNTISNSQSHKISNDTEHLDLLKKEITSGKEIIRFERIMEFDWDSLMILPPYSVPEEVEKKQNVDLVSIEHFGIDSRDDINLIVFLKKNKPIRVIAYPRYPGDFSNNEIEVIEKSKANYKIELTDKKTVDGRQWIRLTKE